jgi:hypothetical protein
MVLHCLKNKKLALFFLLYTTTQPMHAHLHQTADTLVCVFMAGINNLAGFAPRNIKQMAAIGSNQNLHIAVHLDIRLNGNKKVSRRYYIEPNKINHVNAQDPATQQMDSGNPETAISFFNWCVDNCPAKHYVFIFWNHGYGIIDPQNGYAVDTSKLFHLNPAIRKLELDRRVDFLDLIEKPDVDPKGICWDDITGNYLTNQKLEYALEKMTQKIGRKLDIVVFDACLMSMIEIANILKKHAHYMVSSQEVVLGPGYNYKELLAPFAQPTAPDMQSFAKHIVTSYKKTYSNITNDYTQSAIDLDELNNLEKNIDLVSSLLLECLSLQYQQQVKSVITMCKNPSYCTHFDLSSYIDLQHFYKNLLNNLSRMVLKDDSRRVSLISELRTALQAGLEIIQKTVIENVAGPNLAQASGLAIYFPDRKIHTSYKKTSFSKDNAWGTLLTRYILS